MMEYNSEIGVRANIRQLEVGQSVKCPREKYATLKNAVSTENIETGKKLVYSLIYNEDKQVDYIEVRKLN